MKLSENDIVKNWNELLRVIKESFTGERLDKILKLMEYFEDRMPFTPASAVEHYHCAYPGGYVKHILGVIECAKKLKSVWASVGCNINFTDEELVFSALFHDLGKVGDMNNDYYIANQSEWHRTNQGKIYEFNSKLDYMSVTDRTFVLLNEFGIKYSNNEFLSIRLADGLYSKYNEGYLITYNDANALKTNLPYIIHAADFMAMHSEYDEWKNLNNSEHGNTNVLKSKTKYNRKETLVESVSKSNIDSNSILTDANKLFDSLFNSAT